MNILIIHNIYSNPGGEERVVEMQRQLLSEQGNKVIMYYRNYSEIKQAKFGKIKSFFSAILNIKAAKEIKNIIENEKIEIIIIHNLYPIISPYFLFATRKLDIKRIMILHNYRLICPIGLFLRDGKPCEKCGSKLKELNCIKYRCEGSLAGSIAYASRGATARIFKLFKKYIDVFVATTIFQKEKLENYGYKNCAIKVVPNFTDFKPNISSTERDGSILYVGRFSKEKGFDLVIDAAKRLPNIKFKMAGNYDNSSLEVYNIPKNIELLGEVNKERLTELYRSSSLMIFPTRCYESFPLTLLEAGVNKLPIIAANIGATSTIINDGENGILFTPSDIESLVQKIEETISDKEILNKISNKNFELITGKYSKSNYNKKILTLLSRRKEEF